MKRMTLIVFCLSLGQLTCAQQFPSSAQYLINPYSLNAALAGHNANFECFAGYQRNWLGIQGAPQYQQFNLNGPIAKSMGIGAQISDYRVGIFRSATLQLSYAYHAKLGDQSTIGLGASVGILDQHIDVSTNTTDPALFASFGNQKKSPTAGFGVYYQWRGFLAGLAAPSLLENKISLSDTLSNAAYTQLRHYRTHFRYQFKLNNQWTLSPMALVNTNGISLMTELSAMLNYKNLIWLALAFNQRSILGIHIGGLPLPNVAMQYSYGMATGGILSQSNGNHEFGLGILIGGHKNNLTSIFQIERGTKAKSYYKWVD